ncbi:MAG: protein-disulfide reductase DsbD domain-containing protein [Planctomycetota bacterium]
MSALLLVAALAWPPQDATDNRGDRLVKVELLADRAAIRPGEAFSLGVRLVIEPKWHIYWENHGDSGMPTRAKISGPKGFTLGAPRFPGPEREEAEGDIVSYVHYGEIVLVVDGVAPDPMPSGIANADFTVEANWLVCTQVCYPGSGEAKLQVPIAAQEAKPAPANDRLFLEARAKLPKPWSELAGASIEWSGDDGSPVAVITVPGAADLEFFPLASESTSLLGREIEPGAAACRLSASLSFEPPAPGAAPRLEGLLRVRKERSGAFYRLDSTPNPPASPAGSR